MENNKTLKTKSGSFSYNDADELVSAWMDNQSTNSVSIRFALQEYIKVHGTDDVLASRMSDLGDKDIISNEDVIKTLKFENESLRKIIEDLNNVIAEYKELKLSDNFIVVADDSHECTKESEPTNDYDVEDVNIPPIPSEEVLEDKVDEDPHNADSVIVEELVDDTYKPEENLNAVEEIVEETEEALDEETLSDIEEFEKVSDEDTSGLELNDAGYTDMINRIADKSKHYKPEHIEVSDPEPTFVPRRKAPTGFGEDPYGDIDLGL